VAPPPGTKFEGFPCDEPHQGEVLLEFQVTDPAVTALAADPVRFKVSSPALRGRHIAADAD
ncbi:MAG: hypothetical protein ACRDY5_04455, partial [Acidimicrobiales bacterium]